MLLVTPAGTSFKAANEKVKAVTTANAIPASVPEISRHSGRAEDREGGFQRFYSSGGLCMRTRPMWMLEWTQTK